MAMSCMIHGASSTVIPHAIRPITSSPKIMSATSNNSTAICSGAQQFCTDAKKKLLNNEKILRALSSEIKSEEQCPIKPMPQIPPNFPFTIVDDPWENHITLKRNFAGEKIELSIEEFDEFDRIVEEDEEEEEEESGGVVSDKDESTTDRFWPFFEVDVKISKQSGRTLVLQVSAATNEVSPNDMRVEEGDGKQPAIYTGRAMENDMQIVMREYLETIGLTTSNVGIVYKYLVGRYKRRPRFMLQKLKNYFVE